MRRRFRAILAIGLVGSLAGCYERVVDARGFGADTVDVYRDDQKPIDRMMEPRDRRRGKDDWRHGRKGQW